MTHLFRTIFCCCLLYLIGCQTESSKPSAEEKQQIVPRGELAFLLSYTGNLPSQVGFISNHIVERRLAVLMKENFLPLRNAGWCEEPIQSDGKYLLWTMYTNCADSAWKAVVAVDVANDHVLCVTNTGTVSVYSDTSNDTLLKFIISAEARLSGVLRK